MVTVLIIDDAESLRDRVAATLRAEKIADHFLMAPDGASGIALLRTEKVDLVFCDLVMPSIDGMRFLSIKQDMPEYANVPVIFLTGTSTVDEKVRAFATGASDYLTKPFHNEELVARARVHLELKFKSEQLKQLAMTDELTGISNRRNFLDCCRRELHRGGRRKSAVGLLMIDVDNFKKVNDQHGHQVGDAVLREVARALEHDLRASDLVGRYGGEEFIVLLPDSAAEGVRITAERCRKRVEASSPPGPNGPLAVTASFGALSISEPAKYSVDQIIRAADTALYKAKAQGRNCVVFSDAVEV